MARFQMSPVSVKNSDHLMIHAGSIFLAVITQICSGVFYGLAKDNSVPNALFQSSTRNVCETFPLEVTMDWWSENNWVMIDIWSAAWLVEAVVRLFKRNVLGPESCNPEIHSPFFYLMWATINCARICSMFLWDRHDIVGAVTLSWILPGLSFYMLHMSYSSLNRHKEWLAINNKSVIWWTRYLTQNGLALFAWWSLLKAVVGFGIMLKYKAGVEDPLISTAVLSVIFFCNITWFILQSFVFIRYMYYTFTVYPIVILSLGSMFTRSYLIHGFTTNTVYCGFLMLLMTVMSMIHLVSVCVYTDKSSKPLVVEPYLTFESCETVCQPEAKSKLPNDATGNAQCKI